ncbi:MAG: hypothetical protein O6703_07055, partial [Gammaproteobacteria bacterium]|nr:hypothetical protein [Gammaproteobacteria bacterium]
MITIQLFSLVIYAAASFLVDVSFLVDPSFLPESLSLPDESFDLLPESTRFLCLPVLKSVSYQPEPPSLNLDAEIFFFRLNLPQAGHS